MISKITRRHLSKLYPSPTSSGLCSVARIWFSSPLYPQCTNLAVSSNIWPTIGSPTWLHPSTVISAFSVGHALLTPLLTHKAAFLALDKPIYVTTYSGYQSYEVQITLLVILGRYNIDRFFVLTYSVAEPSQDSISS